MKNKNGSTTLVVVIILVVAIMAGAIGYLAAKKSPALEQSIEQNTVDNNISGQAINEMANWQTYRNEKYGFEVKYPDILNYSETEIPQSSQESAVKGDDYIGPETFTFALSKEDPKNTENGITMTVIKRVNKNSILVPGIEEGNILIDGEKALKYSGSFFVEKNGYAYRLSAFGDVYYSNLLNKIISTFKFIDSTETSTWQTYRNEKYGFEFQYPPVYILDSENYRENSLDVLLKKSDSSDIMFRSLEPEKVYDPEAPNSQSFKVLPCNSNVYRDSNAVSVGEFSIVGIPAAKHIFTGPYGGPATVFSICKDERKILFEFRDTVEMKNILSTFKFTK